MAESDRSKVANRPRFYTKEVLELAVKSSLRWKEVAEKLGKDPTANNSLTSHLRKMSKIFGIDYSHIFISKPVRKHSKESLQTLVDNNDSLSSIARILGVNGKKCVAYIKQLLDEYNIDYSHYEQSSVRKRTNFVQVKRKTIEQLLSSKYVSSAHLRKRLIQAGLKKNQCEYCGIVDWNDAKISFDLDHINSNRYDNRLENLQVLCPNCHRQKTCKDMAIVGKRFKYKDLILSNEK